MENIKIIREASRNIKPFISVIMPIYNSEKYLVECIDSVVKQTLSNIEIICVDDGSTDNSLDMLSKYAEEDDRITILSQQNQYACVARNNGLQFARGKYVIFLDSDDFFELDMLELTYEKIELEQAEICVFDLAMYNTRTGEIIPSEGACLDQFVSKEYPSISARIAGRFIFGISNAGVWNKLYLREFIQKFEGGLKFPVIRTSDDFTFCYTCFALAEKITFLKKVLVYYRRGVGESLEDTKYSLGRFDFVDALDELRSNLVKHGAYDYSELKLAFANISCYRIMWHFQELRDETIFKNLYQLLKNKVVDEYEFNLLNDKNINNRESYELVKDLIELEFDEFLAIHKTR